MQTITEIQLHPKQGEFVSSQAALALFVGGVGSGKSWGGAFWTMMQACEYPLAIGLVGSNTYKQLQNSTLPKLKELFARCGIKYVYNRKPPSQWGIESRFDTYDGIITTSFGAQLHTYSLDNYDPIRGIEIGYFWIDETRDTAPEAIKILFERLRGYNQVYPDMKYMGRFTTTPNGFDYIWETFVQPGTRLKDTEYFSATTHDNVFLPHSYAQDLEGRLGKQLAKQQIYAEFINLAVGRAFAFDRSKHIRDVKFDKDLPLWFSMDFNVSPLCGVVLQIDAKRRTAYVLDEVYIQDNAQTKEACKEFVRRWKGISSTVIIGGDISGKHRDTRSEYSDHDIMRREIKDYFQVSDAFGGAGSVFDGIQAVNALLDPMQGEPRLLINPKCERLIIDLESVAFKPGTQDIDKTNKQATHLCDALRYPLSKELPVMQSIGPKMVSTNSRGLY